MKEIAKGLFIAESTVNFHLTAIRKKVGANNTIEMLYLLCQTSENAISNFNLTSRNKDIFQLFIQGCTYDEIGTRLNISYSGVRRHMEKILVKNDCANINELIGKYYNPNRLKSE